MVNHMRHNRSRVGMTRSHHALKNKESIAICPDCKAKKINHQACANCGKYNGRIVIDVMSKVIKKEKKNKEKSKEKGK